MIGNVTKIGTSLGIIIPRHIAKEGGFLKGSPIEIKFENNIISITKVPSVREGWAQAFAAYVREGEDEMAMPDYLDSEAMDVEM